jgi:hypothetical protein
MNEALSNKEIDDKRQVPADRWDTWVDDDGELRVLSKKAQEAKIFIEKNPIPKEFLKS